MTTIVNTFLDKDNVIYSSGIGGSSQNNTPIVSSTNTLFGASTQLIDSFNSNSIFLEIKPQFDEVTTSPQNCVTTGLFGEIGYYGYFAYPSINGVITSITENGVPGGIGNWINNGIFIFNGVSYYVYRTVSAQQYQGNQVLSFIR